MNNKNSVINLSQLIVIVISVVTVLTVLIKFNLIYEWTGIKLILYILI